MLLVWVGALWKRSHSYLSINRYVDIPSFSLLILTQFHIPELLFPNNMCIKEQPPYIFSRGGKEEHCVSLQAYHRWKRIT